MKSETENPISYLVLGLGLGFVAGMLLAPRRGYQTRDDLLGSAANHWNALSAEGAKLRNETYRWLELIRGRFCSPANGTAEEQNAK